jgi:hypothetical protein
VTAPPKKERHLCGMALRKLRLLRTGYHRLGLIPAPFCFPFGRRETARSRVFLTWQLAWVLFLLLGLLVKAFALPYRRLALREDLGAACAFLADLVGAPFWFVAQKKGRLCDWFANHPQQEDCDAN